MALTAAVLLSHQEDTLTVTETEKGFYRLNSVNAKVIADVRNSKLLSSLIQTRLFTVPLLFTVPEN